MYESEAFQLVIFLGASEWPEAGALLGAWNFIELNWKLWAPRVCVGNLILAAAVSMRAACILRISSQAESDS